MKVNSNTPGIPRNIGLNIARGEYIMFVDSDDAVTETALEELYPIAKKFDTDVVYCEKCYRIRHDEKFTTNKKFLKESVCGNDQYTLVSEPTFASENIRDRLKDLISLRFYVVPWNYLIRRELIAMHDIRFPNVKYGSDNFWDLYIVCLAKSIVRVPNSIYIHRMRNDSNSSTQSLEINIRRYTDHVCQGVSIINEFAEKFTFLKEHPEFRYVLFHFLADAQFQVSVEPIYSQIPDWKLEPLVKRELDKIDDKTSVAAFLFSRMNVFTLNFRQQIEYLEKTVQNANAAIMKQKSQIEYFEKQLAYYRTALEQALR